MNTTPTAPITSDEALKIARDALTVIAARTDDPLIERWCDEATKATEQVQAPSGEIELPEFVARSIRDYADFREDLERLSAIGLSNKKQARTIRKAIYDTIDARVRNSVVAALAQRAGAADKPVAQQLPIELMGVAEEIAEGSGFWRSCSGCHESSEGYATGPHSAVFGCALGDGCRECGGIGAVWDDTDYEAMGAEMAAEMLAAPVTASADAAPAGAQTKSPANAEGGKETA